MTTHSVIVEAHRVFAATPGTVFAILADPARWSALDDALVKVEPLELLVAGSAGTMRRRAGLGLTVTTAWRNVEFERDSRLSNLITGFGYELLETVVLEPIVGGGTTMSVLDTLTPTSIVGRAMVAMSHGIIERDLQARLSKLATLFEPGPAPNGLTTDNGPSQP